MVYNSFDIRVKHGKGKEYGKAGYGAECLSMRSGELPRHGDCDACREHHHTSKRKLLTYCEKLERKALRKNEKQAI